MTLDGIEIGIIKSNGRYYAFRNLCPHEGGPVCTGTITGALAQGPETEWKLIWEKEGEILYCPWHGSDFDITTCEAMSRKGMRLKTYPLKVEQGTLKITL